jgi:hypothetical protein
MVRQIEEEEEEEDICINCIMDLKTTNDLL